MHVWAEVCYEPRVRLYAASEVDEVPWPSTPQGKRAREYFSPLLRDGVQRYVANAKASMHLLELSPYVLPLTVSEGGSGQSMVASTYSHYVSASLEELAHVSSRLARTAAQAALRAAAPVARWCGLDQTVMVNNWLFSTNLHPQLSVAEVVALRDYLVARYPDFALVFRTVDPIKDEILMASLREAGFQFVFSRPTYLMEPSAPGFKPPRNLKDDLKHYAATDCFFVSGEALRKEDPARLQELYHQLYIEKYSPYNPRYTEDFFRLALRGGGVDLVVAKKKERAVGCMGFVEDDRFFTAAFIGYDQKSPPQEGFYRLMMTHFYLAGKESQKPINFSAGVGRFKRLRGCRLNMEYTAVYTQHLPWRRRLPWDLLTWTTPLYEKICARFEM